MTSCRLLPHVFLERRLLTTGARRVTYFTIAHNLYSFLASGFEIALILRLTGSFERIVVFNLFKCTSTAKKSNFRCSSSPSWGF